MSTTSSPSPAAVLLLAAAAAAVLTVTAVPAPRQDPADLAPPAGCVVDGHFMAVGEVFNTGPEPCSTYTCHEPNSVYALTCAFWTAGEGCEIVAGNQSSVYPGCCPTESCSDNLINVDEKEKYSL